MKRFLISLFLFGVAGPAMAHTGPGLHGSLVAGMVHPLFGLDHLIAMLAVGRWASTLSGRTRWAVP
ncbi:MAG: HupE/UreJ family protein, partial [Qingshengfaniella sp.]